MPTQNFTTRVLKRIFENAFSLVGKKIHEPDLCKATLFYILVCRLESRLVGAKSLQTYANEMNSILSQLKNDPSFSTIYDHIVGQAKPLLEQAKQMALSYTALMAVFDDLKTKSFEELTQLFTQPEPARQRLQVLSKNESAFEQQTKKFLNETNALMSKLEITAESAAKKASDLGLNVSAPSLLPSAGTGPHAARRGA